MLLYAYTIISIKGSVDPILFGSGARWILSSFALVYVVLTTLYVHLHLKGMWQFVKVVLGRKIHLTLLTLIINGLVLAGVFYLINLSANNPSYYPLVLPLSVITIVILVLLRLIWIRSLQEIYYGRDSSRHE